MFQTELANEKPYKASISGIRLRLAKLQESNNKAQKTWVEGIDGYKNVNRVLHYQELPFISKIIPTKLISRHHDNSLAGHFGINKTKELIRRKYY